MPYDSTETLVFRCQKSQRNSNDITPNGGAKWRWGKFESGDFYHRTTLPLRRSTAATLYSSAMIYANDAFTVAERYRRTAINNVRSKSITGVVYINPRCARTVPSALAELLVVQRMICGSSFNFCAVQTVFIAYMLGTEKNTPKCFRHIFYKTRPIPIEFGTHCPK